MNNYIGPLALVSSAILISFTNQKLAAHTLSFVGSTFIAAEVADETLWQEITPVLSCPGTQEVACRIVVPDDTYVVFNSTYGVNVLNVNKLDIGAIVGYTSPTPFFIQQYKPTKVSGSGTLSSITNCLHY